MRGHQGRRYAIAGAGTGAGRALAILAAQNGAHVVVGARTRSRVTRTVALARRAGDGHATGYAVDFVRRPGADRFLRRACKDLGGLDAVFCLVGGWFPGALHEQDTSRIEEAIASFLRPVLVLNQVAPAHLGDAHGPAIINFSSATGGAVSVRGQTLYNTMKAAVAELTRSLAADLIPRNVRVNAVLPGAISHKYHFGREYQSRRRLGSGIGAPEDVAHAALFLASPEASWITGATLVVDGGLQVNRGL